MRLLLPVMIPALLLTACASLKPATFVAFRHQGELAGMTRDCAYLYDLAGDDVVLEKVANRTLRFAPPPGGDIALIEWTNVPCAHARLALSAPGRATRETAAAQINQLGVKIGEPWGWVLGLGVVYRTEDPKWFGLFDPSSGRVGIAVSDYTNEFKRPGLIATRPQLDRGIEGALAAGKTDMAASLLVHRETWFGPAPALAARVAAQKAKPASAPAKPGLPAAPASAPPLEAWQFTMRMLRAAKPDEAARWEPELPLRHAAAVADLQARIAAVAEDEKPATAAALRLQLASLLGEDAKGAQRLAAEEILRRWLSRALMVAPVPGSSTAVALDWRIPATKIAIADTDAALRMAPADTAVTLGGIEDAGVAVRVESGTALITVRDPHAAALAAQRSAKQAEIDEAKSSLADAQRRLAALERAANAGGSGGGSQPYGRADRGYNSKPGSDVYRDTYNTKVYSGMRSATITPEMRAVGMEIDRAESTIRIRSQELANLPASGSDTRLETIATEEQQWSGKVRRMVTLMRDGFTTTVPAEIDLSRYRFAKHERYGQASARNDWKTADQVVALAAAELEKDFAKRWPGVLREATRARVAALAGPDGAEARWGRFFAGGDDAEYHQELQVPSLAGAQKLRAAREARGTSDFIARLNKPADIGNNACGGAPVMSADGAHVAWCGALFDAETGARRFQLMPGLATDARFSADGKRVALFNAGRSRITVWSTVDGAPLSERDGRAIQDSDVGPRVAAPANRALTLRANPDAVAITDKAWVRPRTDDYSLTFATGTALTENKMRIDKGESDGIRKGQPVTVLSKHIGSVDGGRWEVTEVSEQTALVEGPNYYGDDEDFLKESAPVVVRGFDLVP